MPMDFLLALAQGNLPRTISDEADVDKLRVLAAVKLVNVELPDVGASSQVAEVKSLTIQGEAALRRTYRNISFDF